MYESAGNLRFKPVDQSWAFLTQRVTTHFAKNVVHHVKDAKKSSECCGKLRASYYLVNSGD